MTLFGVGSYAQDSFPHFVPKSRNTVKLLLCVYQNYGKGGKRFMQIKKGLIFISCILLCLSIVYTSEGRETIKIPSKTREIGINEVLFAPSAFTTAIKDNVTLFGYIRTNLEEGEAPTDVQQTVKDAERIIGLRLRSWGFSVGWQGDMNIDINEPYSLSVDYKVPFRLVKGISNAALDFKYSTKKIKGLNIRQSILDFGVLSITGIMSKEITPYFELYGGVSANYIYFDASSDVLTDMWKYVPLAGLRIYLSNYYDVQLTLEAGRGKINSDEKAIWTWNLGAAVGF